jgi:N-acetyl sugar amidotransferase
VEHQHTAKSQKKVIRFVDGVCDACRVAEEKRFIDWDDREKQLRDLCDQYRKTDGSYDCLVPGSGGKDSFMQTSLLRDKYGMHPLTVTWAPHLYTDYGHSNFIAWINDGIDNFKCTPNGKTHRLLTRLAVDNLFHPFQPFVFGQKNLGPKMAALFNIPLVFYGENEAEYGNPKLDTVNAQRDWSYFTGHDDDVYFGGVSVAELLGKHKVQRHDLKPYFPADPQLMHDKGIQVHYLGYYERWNPQEAYYYVAERAPKWSCRPFRTQGTYSKYNSIDDKVDDLHYWTTHVKFGIGRATHDASQETRNGYLNREEAVALVKRFDGEWPSHYESDLMEYLSVPGFSPMTKDSLFDLSDKFRSPHLWSGRKLKYKVWA